MKRRLVYSRDALKDLRGITRYTIGRHGAAQAVAYVSMVRARAREVAGSETLGEPYEGPGGYWRIQAGLHYVFFRRQADTLSVVRILHVVMLPELHLPDETPQ